MSARQRVLITAFTVLCAAGCSESEKPAAPSDPPQPAPAVEVPEMPPAELPPPAATAPLAAPVTPAPPAEEDGAASASRGRTHYLSYCATCHGAAGNGDGPLSATLVPPPARHSDGAYMNPLADEYLHRVIKDGGAAVGKSPSMAPWGGALSDAQIDDVVAYIRTLAEPAYAP